MLASAAWLTQAPAQGSQPRTGDRARTLVAGSAERRLILDALRRQLRSHLTFKVAFVAIAGSHAFVRAGEVVRDGDALQETDLFVESLLVRRMDGRRPRWQVLEFWNLSTQSTGEQHRVFLARVQRVMRDHTLPPSLLPLDLRAMPPQ